jgi:hypothetical protein
MSETAERYDADEPDAERLALVTRLRQENDALRDCLANWREWLFDRANRLGSAGLYPDDLAEETEALLMAREEAGGGDGGAAAPD